MEKKHIVETTAHDFIARYGAEEFVNWLKEFEKNFDTKQYEIYRKLEKEAGRVYNIPFTDIIRSTRDECTDARRIISYIAVDHLKMKPKNVARLLGNRTVRTINNYINDSVHRIENHNHFKEFFNTYNVVMEKIVSNGNN